jgi:hypothetical protein
VRSRHQIFDTVVVHPLAFTNVPLVVKEPSEHLEKAVKEKRRKLEERCRLNNYKLVPLAFDKLGNMHDGVLKLIDECGGLKMDWVPRNYVAQTHRTYWIQRIGCVIQAAVAWEAVRLSRYVVARGCGG